MLYCVAVNSVDNYYVVGQNTHCVHCLWRTVFTVLYLVFYLTCNMQLLVKEFLTALTLRNVPVYRLCQVCALWDTRVQVRLHILFRTQVT